MNKKPFIGFLIIGILLIGGGFFIGQGKGAPPSIGGELKSPIYSLQNKVDTSVWKKYTNNQVGFTFRYPVTWRKYGNDIKVSDRFKNVTEIEINFIDTISNATLSIDCHLGPNGTGRYKYALSSLKSPGADNLKESKKIIVAGNKAIETFTTINVDGKGNPIVPTLSMAIDFLNKKQTGSVELQFRTSEANKDGAVANINLLLSTFKFIN